MLLESLEERRVLSTWLPQGPAPSVNGQVERILPNNEVIGAIHTVLAHPTNPDALYIGAVNGGVWRTENATSPSPHWEPLTDDLPSLAISAMDMDPADPNRILAGTGRYSAFADSGPLSGLMLTEDGGDTWTVLDDPLLVNRNISGVAVRGNLLLASAGGGSFDGFDRIPDGGLFQSLDNGATWTSIEVVPRDFNNPDDPVPFKALDLVGDPTDPQRFYTSVQDVGIFRSDNEGDLWTNVTIGDPAINPLITGGGNNNLEMAVASDGRVYAAVIIGGAVNYIGFSDSQGGDWIAMDLPQTPEVGGPVGLNPNPKPGGQGSIHFSIVVDPTDPKTVYVGGDRQGGSVSNFPGGNFIGALDFSGRLFRGDTRIQPTGQVPSPQWEHLTHSDSIPAIPEGGTRTGSAPHADSREMVFDANGQLIEVDDGGIYRRTNPRSNTGDWFSLIGNLQVTEFHDIAYDSVTDTIMGGTQDIGTLHQVDNNGTMQWAAVSVENLPFVGRLNADGGDVAIDDTSIPGQSIRYSSRQFLGFFRRQTYNSENELIEQEFINLPGGIVPNFVTPVELNKIDPERMVLGGANAIFESENRGNTFTAVPGPGFGIGPGVALGQNAIVYGGWQNGSPNPDVLYVGSGGEVFVRTVEDEPLNLTQAQFPGGEIRDLILHTDDWMTAYVAGRDRIFETTNAGDTWTEITGNLSLLGAGELRTLQFVNGTVVLGTNAGVFASPADKTGSWARLGSHLPNAPVYDMEYDATDNVIVLGTLGRGAWMLKDASSEVAAATAGLPAPGEDPTEPPPPATGSISGRKWNDTDADGDFEPLDGETGLGFTYIYADLNNDNIPGVDEPGAITATDGTYTLGGLPAGTYVIREALAAGMEQTFPGAAANFVHVVTLTEGQRIEGMDFGNRDTSNRPPTVNPLPDQTAQEDVPFNFSAGTFFNDLDIPSGDMLTFSATTVGGGPLPGWLSFNSATGTFSGTPGSGDLGVTDIVVTGTDRAGASVSDTFRLTVIASGNNPPFIDPGQQFDVIQDSGVGTVVGTVQASDPDAGDVLTFSIVSGDPNGVFAIGPSSGQITVARDGFLSAGSGPFALGVQVADPAQATDVETVTIDVIAPQQLVAFQLDTYTLDGTPIPDGGTVAVGERFELRGIVEDVRGFFATGVFAGYLDVAYDDSIVDVVVGETQTLEILGNPTGGSYTLTFAGQTTAPIPLGTDAGAVQSALEALSTIGTDNVRVRRVPPTEDAPNPFVFEITFQNALAQTDVGDVTADGSLLTGGTAPSAQVTNSFPADPANPGSFRRAFVFGENYPNGLSAERLSDELSEVGAFDGETPLGGGAFPLFSVILEAVQDGTFAFAGNPADVSPEHDVLLFGSDDAVPPASIFYDSTEINVVEIVNNPPTATDDEYTTDEDTPLLGNVITDDTGNGADFDPDPSDVISVTAVNGGSSVGAPVQLASGATLTVNSDGSFQYDPTTSAVLNALRSDQDASDVFSYTIEDLAGEQATANVSITITGVNDRPTVDPATFTIEEDSNVGAVVGTVTATDPDNGDVLSFEIIAGNTNDTFAIGSGSGVITVANPALLTEGASFSLTVEATDSGVPALSDTAVITVNVVAAAEPLVRFRLDVTDLDGNPLPMVEGQPQVNVGDDFLLHGFVEDTRGFTATGVFSAYLDVFYNNAANVSLIVGETWTLTLSPNVTGGTYTVTFEGLETTDPISLGTNLTQAAGNLQQALEGLNGIGPDNVRVISTPLRDPDDPEIILNPFIFEIQFTGDLAGQDITAMSVDGSALTTSGGPATATVEETFPADPANPGAFRSAFLFEAPYVNGRSAVDEPAEAGRPATERVLGEVGAFDGQTPLGGGEFPLFSVAFNADADGQLVFQGNPADVAGNDVLVFGRDDPVALNDIDYGDPITVALVMPAPATFSNPNNALDVNADGLVSALDALNVINELNRNGTRALTGAAESAATAALAESGAMPSSYVDVNADGSVTPLDALIVVNALNRGSAAMAAAPMASSASATAASGGDGVSARGMPMPELPLTGNQSHRGAFTRESAAFDGEATEFVEPEPALVAARDERFAPEAPDVTTDEEPPTWSDPLPSEDMESVLNELAAEVAAGWQDETNREESPLRVS